MKNLTVTVTPSDNAKEESKIIPAAKVEIANNFALIYKKEKDKDKQPCYIYNTGSYKVTVE